MVDCAGGYYREAFQGLRGVTQGDPLYPTVFNVVLDVVVRHCVLLVMEGVEGKEGWVREMLRCTALFYVGDGLTESTDPEWLQGAFNNLLGLFNRVGIKKNVGKTIVMI